MFTALHPGFRLGFTKRSEVCRQHGSCKRRRRFSRIMQWKPMASSRINFAEIYLFFNDESRLHQPSINAMLFVTRQSDEHDDIPNPTPEQRHDTSEDEVAVDDYQE
ncbi:hypothetical protein CUMW_135750 [Citrus unshiu]|nr:hypothetical protein CUMW_135750 [Citrus unshiu]